MISLLIGWGVHVVDVFHYLFYDAGCLEGLVMFSLGSLGGCMRLSWEGGTHSDDCFGGRGWEMHGDVVL